ncbi:hypothetical protein TNCV_4415771 [Trichonephila clavipes]|uniref:Uncharacterized protein n=1 Tax=Trichonephila clavipes TaxID=2585209 RepID=A0A8X6V9M4_TRICX|nr:hypothetical protein TNCV_4415771 [Trichonephila clavipes]
MPTSDLERDRYSSPGVVIRESIRLNGRNELHVFHRGSVIRNRYCKEVILTHVRLFLGANGSDFVFMGVNTRPHQIADIQQLLENEFP